MRGSATGYHGPMLTARMRKRWTCRATECPDLASAAGMLSQARLHPLLTELLAMRSVADVEASRRFLNPTLKDLRDPARLPGCTAAAERIAQAVRDGQPIVIYGDYDVDGVTASAILWRTLKHLGHTDVYTYVPHRIDEGYGLNAEAITTLAQQHDHPLIVTVDCGITACDVARHAKSLGVDLIITDHHHFELDDLPETAALVHPELPVDGEAESEASPLCGAGVAFKLAWQVARTHFQTDNLPGESKRFLLDLLPLAALGTVADVVPLVGENRTITVHGLSRIKHTDSLGLNALIDAAELRDDKIDAYHVGFILGPRLNACGRMGHARQAVTLLTDASPAQARELAQFLTAENDRRRRTERQIVEQAKQMVEEGGHAADDRRAIVLAHEDWHPGVIGIVASRLVEAYHRPTVLLGIDATTGLAKGSARSIDGFDLHAAMSRCAHHCNSFGGHAMAAGLAMPADAIDAYRQDLIEVVNQQLTTEDLVPTVHYDADLPIGECSIDLFATLERMAPFGRDNPRPTFRVADIVTARPAQRMGKQGSHMSLSLRSADPDSRVGLRAVAFGMGDLADDLPAGVPLEMVVQPKINTWRGVSSPELQVIDLRLLGQADSGLAPE